MNTNILKCAHAHTHTCSHTHTHTSLTHTHLSYTHKHTHTHIQIKHYTHAHAKQTCAYMHTDIKTYRNTHKQTSTHTYTHTRTHTLSLSFSLSHTHTHTHTHTHYKHLNTKARWDTDHFTGPQVLIADACAALEHRPRLIAERHVALPHRHLTQAPPGGFNTLALGFSANKRQGGRGRRERGSERERERERDGERDREGGGGERERDALFFLQRNKFYVQTGDSSSQRQYFTCGMAFKWCKESKGVKVKNYKYGNIHIMTDREKGREDIEKELIWEPLWLTKYTLLGDPQDTHPPVPLPYSLKNVKS